MIGFSVQQLPNGGAPVNGQTVLSPTGNFIHKYSDNIKTPDKRLSPMNRFTKRTLGLALVAACVIGRQRPGGFS